MRDLFIIGKKKEKNKKKRRGFIFEYNCKNNNDVKC